MIHQVRGTRGSVVHLTIVRAGTTFHFPLVRTRITVTSVVARLEQDRIAYIRIRLFNEQTTSAVQQALQAVWHQLQGPPPPRRRTDLDLHNNPGGVLEQAIAVAGALRDTGRAKLVGGWSHLRQGNGPDAVSPAGRHQPEADHQSLIVPLAGPNRIMVIVCRQT